MVYIWLKSTIQYYKLNNSPQTYFWFHYLFNDLYNNDILFKEIWDSIPKLSANGIGPHYLQEKGLFNTITNQTKMDIDNKITPLYKLTYKCNNTLYNNTLYNNTLYNNTNLCYLYKTIK